MENDLKYQMEDEEAGQLFCALYLCLLPGKIFKRTFSLTHAHKYIKQPNIQSIALYWY